MKARMLLLVFISAAAGPALGAIPEFNNLIEQAVREEGQRNGTVLRDLPDSKTMTYYHNDRMSLRKKKKVADMEMKVRREPTNDQ